MSEQQRIQPESPEEQAVLEATAEAANAIRAIAAPLMGALRDHFPSLDVVEEGDSVFKFCPLTTEIYGMVIATEPAAYIIRQYVVLTPDDLYHCRDILGNKGVLTTSRPHWDSRQTDDLHWVTHGVKAVRMLQSLEKQVGASADTPTSAQQLPGSKFDAVI